MAIAVLGFLASAHAATTKKTGGSTRYWVQSGAFKNAANAEARCAILKKRGYRFAVQRARDSHGDSLFFCRSSLPLAYDQAVSLAQRVRLKEPGDAVLVLQRAKERAASGSGKGEAASDIESFSGRWCGDPAVYGTDPLQTWTVKKGGAVTLQIAARRTPDGQPDQLRGKIEKLPGNLVKLTGETASFRTEVVYAVDGSGLRGVSFRQEIKDNGATMTTIPDSLHRCS